MSFENFDNSDSIKIDSFKDNGFDEFKIPNFTSVEEEYDTLLHGVGLKELSYNSIIKLKGNDTLSFLQRVSTNDLSRLGILKHKSTLFTNGKGRLIDRTNLLSLNEAHYLICSIDAAPLVNRWISRYIITEDIHTEPSNEFRVFEILGPQAESFMTLIFGKNANDLTDENILRLQLDSFFVHILKLRTEQNCYRYEIIVDTDFGDLLLSKLLSENSIFSLKRIGFLAYNNFRIEKGIPQYPEEINDQYNPHELNLMQHVSSSKGCYIGQEVIARLETYDKVQRKLCVVSTAKTNNSSAPIELYSVDKEEAGTITSITDSISKNEKVGLALIRKNACVENGILFNKDKNEYKIIEL